MKKGMTESISIIAAIVVALVVVGILIIVVGDKIGKGSDASNETIDVSVGSLECRMGCSNCCASGYGTAVCERQYPSCECTCD